MISISGLQIVAASRQRYCIVELLLCLEKIQGLLGSQCVRTVLYSGGEDGDTLGSLDGCFHRVPVCWMQFCFGHIVA